MAIWITNCQPTVKHPSEDYPGYITISIFIHMYISGQCEWHCEPYDSYECYKDYWAPIRNNRNGTGNNNSLVFTFLDGWKE